MVQDIQREFDGSQAAFSRVILLLSGASDRAVFLHHPGGADRFRLVRWIGILACLLLLALILFTWLPLAYPSGKYHRKFFLALLSVCWASRQPWGWSFHSRNPVPASAFANPTPVPLLGARSAV